MDQSYKEEHENFVSGSNGTSVIEILMLSLLTSCSSLVIIALKRICIQLNVSSRKYSWFSGISQSLLLCFPLTFGTTLLNTHLQCLFVIFLVGAFLSGIIISRLRSSTEDKKRPINGFAGYVSHYRSHILLDTSISILAVDFPTYPRRLAKTDLFGFGYMDVGVGCFIVAAGIVSPEARRKLITSKWNNIRSAFSSSTVMILLGLLRAISIWFTNYQVHITEYGVHWNFFITMAAVKVLCSSLLSFMSLNKVCLLSGTSVMMYQWFLSGQQGLTQFLLDTHREGFFQENKEGFVSLVGYCFLYLMAAQAGRIIFSSKSEKNIALCLSTVALCSYILMVVSHEMVQPISRRLLNTAYIFWMIFFNSFHILVHLLYWNLIPSSSPCDLLQAINKNSMIHFLFANLLTGLINFTMDTIHASTFQAVAVINIYIAVLSSTVLYLHWRNLRMDFSTLRFKKE